MNSAIARALLCCFAAVSGRLQRRQRRSEGANRRQSDASRHPAIPAAADAHRAHRRLEEGRDAGRRAGIAGQGLRDRPAASALDLCASQWRRAGGGIQGAEGRSDQAAQGNRDGLCRVLGDIRRRHRREQPHHAAARQQRRRRAGHAKRLPRPSQFAVRRRAGRQRSLCRQHRCDRQISLHRRRYQDHRAGHGADAAAGRPDRPSLDQEPGREPRRLEALCRRRLQQQHHRERHGGRAQSRRHPGGRPCQRPLAHLRERPAQSQRPQLRAADRGAVDGGERARRTRPRSRAGLHDIGEGRRLLWLALQLLRPACRSPRQAAAPRPRRQGDRARLRAELACRAARHGLQHRARVCRPPIAAARSSASTAVGTGRS